MNTVRGPRGISLIEAVVALAVMAFGMLAYAGLQSTLRFNSDVAKQRSEAVRIAQEEVENWRAFSVIETTAGYKAYDDLHVVEPDPIPPVQGDNATYTLTRTVIDSATTPTAPRMKTLVVDVSWQDRNGETQTVRLSTTVAASPPALAASLAVPDTGGPLQLPKGRNPTIPVVAKDMGDGTSAFKPPGAGGGTTVWVFNNLTGVIVGVCNTVTTGQAELTSADVSSCSNNANALPLSGFVRFATDMVDTMTGLPRQPTASVAENPLSTALNLGVVLTLTSTGHPSPGSACFADAPATSLTTRTVVPYFCAVFFELGAVPLWSGISTLVPLAFVEPADSVAWTLAVDAADATLTRYRVCRYTPATSDAQSIPNRLHPRNYVNVSAIEPLTNQNFLVIRAGDGTLAFQCPPDVAADPAAGDFVNSNTLPHQPPPPAP